MQQQDVPAVAADHVIDQRVHVPFRAGRRPRPAVRFHKTQALTKRDVCAAQSRQPFWRRHRRARAAGPRLSTRERSSSWTPPRSRRSCSRRDGVSADAHCFSCSMSSGTRSASNRRPSSVISTRTLRRSPGCGHRRTKLRASNVSSSPVTVAEVTVSRADTSVGVSGSVAPPRICSALCEPRLRANGRSARSRRRPSSSAVYRTLICDLGLASASPVRGPRLSLLHALMGHASQSRSRPWASSAVANTSSAIARPAVSPAWLLNSKC